MNIGEVPYWDDLDTYEEKLIDGLKDEAQDTQMAKLFKHVLQLVRRGETSDRTLRAIKLLSAKKSLLLLLYAFRFLNGVEWASFKEKTEHLRGRGVHAWSEAAPRVGLPDACLPR